MTKPFLILALIFAATVSFAGVTVSAPANGATVGSPVHFVASATGSTTIASMIVYVDGNQQYLVYSNNVDTYINVGSGGHSAVIRAWDNWGGVYSQTVNFTVGATSSGSGVTISSPANGATVGSPTNVVASGNSAINAMILYVDGNEAYRTYSSSMNTNVSMGSGQHKININAWDNSGKLYQSPVETITVGAGSTTSSSSSGVTVTSPASGATVGSPAHFVASAKPSGSAPIASMIVYVDGNQQYLVYSNTLDTNISLGSGTHSAIVKAWDNSGQIYQNSFNFTVSGTTTTSTSTSNTVQTSGTNFWDIDQMGGWGDCTVCAGAGGNGPVAGYSLNLNQGSPSIDGRSAKFSIWGSTPYADVLWWKQLNDGYTNASVNTNAHHFVYDTYFMINDPNAAQALEFDINQFVNGHSLIFGTQCNIRAGNRWDIWDNVNSRWVGTGKSCTAPSASTWHHVVIEVERATDGGDWLHYISIEMDGNKTYIDAWYAPTATSWRGITVNFQMDGNYAMQPYTVWLDKFNLLTW